MTILLKLDPQHPDKEKIRQAARVIRSGGIVVFPTETVYGIGANALDEKAATRIYRIKGRPLDNPMIVHVSSMEMAQEIAKIPEKYVKILDKIWPAPFTIIVPVKRNIPKVVTGGLSTIAIRMPSSKVALALIIESAVPIAAPSANISKKPSSTNASHAKKYFSGKVDMIIDAGSSRLGLESTVMNLKSFEILRPGTFTPMQIKQFFGREPKVRETAKGTAMPKKTAISPGTKYKHYSPTTKLVLFNGDIRTLPEIMKGTENFSFIGSNEACKAMKGTAKSTIPMGKRSNLKELASNLFDALIKVDDLEPKFAIAESFTDRGVGLAIMNRLHKASGNKSFKSKKELESILKSR